MNRQWSDVELWAMAEQLTSIMEALRYGQTAPTAQVQFRAQPELPLGHGGNVIPFPCRRKGHESSTRNSSRDRSGTS